MLRAVAQSSIWFLKISARFDMGPRILIMAEDHNFNYFCLKLSMVVIERNWLQPIFCYKPFEMYFR